MTISTGASLYTVAFGSRPEQVEIPVVAKVSPSATNVAYPIGKRWVNTVANTEYCLTSMSATAGQLTATWSLLGSSSGALDTLTTQDSTVVSPTAGNINVSGASNQLTTSGSGSTVTLSLSPTLVAPGSVTATTTLTATLGAITATNGNIVLGTAGNKLVSSSVASTIAAGANSFGTFALSGAATTTVSTTAVTTNSLIFLQTLTLGTVTVASTLAVTSRTNGVSFVVTPSQATDTSTVAWFIIN